MGGVPSVLLCLWCRGGCSTATVAAALTFFPPNPPCYRLQKKEGSDELEMVVDENLEATSPTNEVQIARIVSGLSGSRCGEPALTAVENPHKSKIFASKGKAKLGGSGEKGGTGGLPKVARIRGGGTVIPVALYRKANARYTLVYSHGNATDIGAMHDRCAGIADAVGVNVLAYDYTGYGCASGTPTEARTYRDIEAVCAWARKNVLREGEDGSGKNKGHGLILYGQSVGSGPTCYLASEKSKGPFAGVILHSPILSGMRVLTESRALSCLDIYPNVDRASRLMCPVMVMHGARDEEVPWEHGKGIYEAVPEAMRRRPWWVPDRGHNDICEGRRHLREYFARLSAFVRSLERDDNTSTGGAAARSSPSASAVTATPAASRRARARQQHPVPPDVAPGVVESGGSFSPSSAGRIQ
ncbi:unnamed protein product [Scytosiphon promiscuus]